MRHHPEEGNRRRGGRYRSKGNCEGRGGGRGKHPSGLTGREIGLWYASRGKEKRRKREIAEVLLLVIACYEIFRITQMC